MPVIDRLFCIRLDSDYIIKKDDYCWTLIYLYEAKKGKNMGNIIEKPLAYCSSIGKCISRYIDCKTLEQLNGQEVRLESLVREIYDIVDSIEKSKSKELIELLEKEE